MTDKELKNNIKKISIIASFILIVITVLTIYTLGFYKADLSVCSSENYEDDLRALGIEETEFREYLSVFSNLLNDNEDENITILDTVTIFIDRMIAIYQENTNAKTYDSKMLNQVAEELNGAYIDKNIAANEKYFYDADNKIYIKNEEEKEFPICKEIKEISQNGEKIEVEYTVEQNKKEKNIKAIIMKNSNFEYSKYFLVSIEESRTL